MDTNPKKKFYHLSCQLCGEEHLSAKLSDVYYDIFNNDVTINQNFLKLLDLYKKIIADNPTDIIQEIKRQILSDQNLKDIVLSIIKLWYLGVIKSLSDSKASLKGDGLYFHYEALIWKVAHAHPAGLSGGYYGYWAYKPEN